MCLARRMPVRRISKAHLCSQQQATQKQCTAHTHLAMMAQPVAGQCTYQSTYATADYDPCMANSVDSRLTSLRGTCTMPHMIQATRSCPTIVSLFRAMSRLHTGCCRHRCTAHVTKSARSTCSATAVCRWCRCTCGWLHHLCPSAAKKMHCVVSRPHTRPCRRPCSTRACRMCSKLGCPMQQLFFIKHQNDVQTACHPHQQLTLEYRAQATVGMDVPNAVVQNCTRAAAHAAGASLHAVFHGLTQADVNDRYGSQPPHRLTPGE